MKRVVIIGLGSGVGCILLSILLIAIGGLVEEDTPCDIALVLGNQVHVDGTPSDRLVARLERAVSLYRDQQCQYILVSGAVGKEGHDEAVVMARYLVQQHVPAERILVDSEGWTTWHSALNAQTISDEIGLVDPSVRAVSQYFHLSRCRLALKRAGFTTVSSSYARYTERRDLYALIREVPAFAKYFLFKH